MRKVFLLLTFIYVSHQQVKIKCYNCITPIGGSVDVTTYCNTSLYCQGQYCTKGPDAISNGIQHGCIDYPPLETGGPKCKLVTTNTGTHSNCYCKNIDFCNGQTHRFSFSFVISCLLFSVLVL